MTLIQGELVPAATLHSGDHVMACPVGDYRQVDVVIVIIVRGVDNTGHNITQCDCRAPDGACFSVPYAGSAMVYRTFENTAAA